MTATDTLIQIIPLVLAICLVAVVGRAVASGKGFPAVREAVPAAVVLVVAIAVIAGVSSIAGDDGEGDNASTGKLYAYSGSLASAVTVEVQYGDDHVTVNGASYALGDEPPIRVASRMLAHEKKISSPRSISYVDVYVGVEYRSTEAAGFALFINGQSRLTLASGTLTITASGFELAGEPFDERGSGSATFAYEGECIVWDRIGFLEGVAPRSAIAAEVASPAKAGPGQAIYWMVYDSIYHVGTLTTDGYWLDQDAEVDQSDPDGTIMAYYFEDGEEIDFEISSDAVAVTYADTSVSKLFGPLEWRSSGASPTPAPYPDIPYQDPGGEERTPVVLLDLPEKETKE